MNLFILYTISRNPQNSLDSGVYQEYEYNINVIPAWEQGYNGSGVVLCVVDDGIMSSYH